MDIFTTVFRVSLVNFVILLIAVWVGALFERLSKRLRSRWRSAFEILSTLSLIVGIVLVFCLSIALFIEVLKVGLLQDIRIALDQWRHGNHGPALGVLIGIGLAGVLLWFLSKHPQNPLNRFRTKFLHWVSPREMKQ